MAHSLLNLVCSNSLIPRSFGSGAASILIKMRRSKCAKVASVSATSRRSDSESKVKGAASNLEEDVVKSDAGIDEISKYPNRLSRMTVKELRELIRCEGIPSKGSKKDLVSALMTFSSRDQGEGNDRPSKAKRVSPKNMSSKRKVDDSLAQSDAQDISSEAEEIKQQGNRRKSQSRGSNAIKSQSIAATKQKKPVEKLEQLDQDASLMDHGEPWTQLAHKKPQAGWIPYNPRSMRPAPLARDEQYVKLMSWNVNGLRALLKLEAVSVLQLAEKEDFDVLCLQETKLKESDVKDIKDCLIEGYGNSFWTCSVAKLGYSGTAIISRMKPVSVKYGLGVADHDTEGRLVTVEFDSFYLICAYVPNSGDGLKRLDYRVKQWDPSLSSYMKELERSKPVILTGDLNCAHEEIDIFNPAGNRRSAGFTWEERESFKENFLSKGFVDTFRKQHPDVVAYTYWGYRHGGRKTNKGWRLDYFLVSEAIVDKAYDSYILPHVPGSDHCPIGLILRV